MKKGGILLLFLVVCMPISYAEVIDVPGISEDVPEPLRDGPEVKKFVYAGNNIVASIGGPDIEYHHQDRLSNRIITNSDGYRVGKFKSLPFGQKIENSGVDYPFTGKEEDESSLYYFGARYYDDNLGRFTGVDPVKENNPYSYVENNPMNYVDPSGMNPKDDNSNRVALVYPYGYNFQTKDVEMIGQVMGEEGKTMDIYRFDPKNRRNKKNNDILSFVDELHEEYSEVIITGHGLSRKEGFLTLSANRDGEEPPFISWPDYVSRDWLHDFSCGSTCEFDPYSSVNPFTLIAMLIGFDGEITDDIKSLMTEMARGRSLYETYDLTRDRAKVKRIMGGYYGGEDILSEESFNAISWGIIKKTSPADWETRFGVPSGTYDALDSDFRDPLLDMTEGFQVS